MKVVSEHDRGAYGAGKETTVQIKYGEYLNIEIVTDDEESIIGEIGVREHQGHVEVSLVSGSLNLYT